MKKIQLEEVTPTEVFGMIHKVEEPQKANTTILGYNGNDCEDNVDLVSKELPNKIAKKIDVVEKEGSKSNRDIPNGLETEFDELGISLIPKQKFSNKKKIRMRKRIIK